MRKNLAIFLVLLGVAGLACASRKSVKAPSRIETRMLVYTINTEDTLGSDGVSVDADEQEDHVVVKIIKEVKGDDEEVTILKLNVSDCGSMDIDTDTLLISKCLADAKTCKKIEIIQADDESRIKINEREITIDELKGCEEIEAELKELDEFVFEIDEATKVICDTVETEGGIRIIKIVKCTQDNEAKIDVEIKEEKVEEGQISPSEGEAPSESVD